MIYPDNRQELASGDRLGLYAFRLSGNQLPPQRRPQAPQGASADDRARQGTARHPNSPQLRGRFGERQFPWPRSSDQVLNMLCRRPHGPAIIIRPNEVVCCEGRAPRLSAAKECAPPMRQHRGLLLPRFSPGRISRVALEPKPQATSARRTRKDIQTQSSTLSHTIFTGTHSALNLLGDPGLGQRARVGLGGGRASPGTRYACCEQWQKHANESLERFGCEITPSPS